MMKLQNEYGGWQSTAIPDSLKIKINTSTDQRVIHASLYVLFRAFGYVYNQKSGITTAYTTSMKFDFQSDVCHFKVSSISEAMSTNTISKVFKSLLKDIFTAKNRIDPDNRPSQLKYVQTKIENTDVDYDVVDEYNAIIQ